MRFILIVLVVLFHSPIQAQDTPILKWKYKTQAAIVASPIIDQGIVYFGCLDNYLYAINLVNGEEVWKFFTGAPNRSTPLVQGHFIYFLGGSGVLYCLDKFSAKQVWSFKTGGEKKYPLFSFADHFQSTPILDGHIIYFGSGDGNVYALNSEKGTLYWKFTTSGIVHATPAIDRDKLFIGSFDGNFYALNKITGRLIWKFKSVGQRYFPIGEFQGSPAVYGKTVYVGSRDFNLYALDAEKGFCNWNHYFPAGWSVSTPAFYKNMVINGTSDDRILVALDTARGTIAWKTNLQFNIFGSCLICDTVGYYGTLNGRLYAVNVNNGNVLWSYATDGNKLNHGKYFTREEQFNQYSISLLTQDLGKQVAIFYEMGGIFSKPAVRDRLLVFTSSEGSVNCLILPIKT